jgi:hypothetical protein
MAQQYGVEGFCYWHYWFGNGKRLLERPFNEVLYSGKPDFPFCLGWANHSWKHKSWIANGSDELLIEQTYPGTEDIVLHFNTILPAFMDKRYIRVNNKPLFLIWNAGEIPNISDFLNLWRTLAKRAGIEGIHFVTILSKIQEFDEILGKGFDAVTIDLMNTIFSSKNILSDTWHRLKRKLFHIPRHIDYSYYVSGYLKEFSVSNKIYPQIVSNWDHSPRSGKFASQVLTDSTPEKFEMLLQNLFDLLKGKDRESNIVFIRSWNEWAEGNHLEPDLKYGKGHLEALERQLSNYIGEQKK